MFYRMKFDASIGAIFKHCGIDTSQAMEYWPIGRTKVGVDAGKAAGYSAPLAAIYAFLENAVDNYKAGRLNKEQMDYFHARLFNWVEICHQKYNGHAFSAIKQSIKAIEDLDSKNNSQVFNREGNEAGLVNSTCEQSITIQASDRCGNTLEKKVSKKQLNEWENDGLVSVHEVVKVNIIDPMGNHTKEWIVGEDIPAEIVEKAMNPATNEIYAYIVYEDGKPKTNVVYYDTWLVIKAAAGV